MKHRYDMNDTVEFYVVTCKEPGYRDPIVKGWTDDKALLEFYLKFHGMKKKFNVKSTTCLYSEMIKLINETCRNDEIEISTLKTVVRPELGSAVSGKGKHRGDGPQMTTVSLPLTMHDKSLIDDSAGDFCSSMIEYGMLHENIRYFKDKYIDALREIGLLAVIDKTVMQQSSKFTSNVDMDELMILLKMSPGDFR